MHLSPEMYTVYLENARNILLSLWGGEDGVYICQKFSPRSELIDFQKFHCEPEFFTRLMRSVIAVMYCFVWNILWTFLWYQMRSWKSLEVDFTLYYCCLCSIFSILSVNRNIIHNISVKQNSSSTIKTIERKNSPSRPSPRHLAVVIWFYYSKQWSLPFKAFRCVISQCCPYSSLFVPPPPSSLRSYRYLALKKTYKTSNTSKTA